MKKKPPKNPPHAPGSLKQAGSHHPETLCQARSLTDHFLALLFAAAEGVTASVCPLRSPARGFLATAAVLAGCHEYLCVSCFVRPLIPLNSSTYHHVFGLRQQMAVRSQGSSHLLGAVSGPQIRSEDKWSHPQA